MTALEFLPLIALVAMFVIASDRPAVTAALTLRRDVHDPAAGHRDVPSRSPLRATAQCANDRVRGYQTCRPMD
ncbi:hypothetical protein [Mycobacterium sp. URHB0021]|jgi:hypothetical protein